MENIYKLRMKNRCLLFGIFGVLIFVAEPCLAETAREDTESGIKMLHSMPFHDRELQGSIALFERAVVLDPNYIPARKYLAIGYSKYGTELLKSIPEQARHEFECAFYMNPTDDIYNSLKNAPTAGLIASAEQAAESSDWLFAHAKYLVALRQHPDPKIAAKLRAIDKKIKDTTKLPPPILVPLK